MREGGQERPAEGVTLILRAERGGGCDKHSGGAPAKSSRAGMCSEEWTQKRGEQGRSQRAAQPEVRPGGGCAGAAPDWRTPGKLPSTC